MTQGRCVFFGVGCLHFNLNTLYLLNIQASLSCFFSSTPASWQQVDLVCLRVCRRPAFVFSSGAAAKRPLLCCDWGNCCSLQLRRPMCHCHTCSIALCWLSDITRRPSANYKSGLTYNLTGQLCFFYFFFYGTCGWMTQVVILSLYSTLSALLQGVCLLWKHTLGFLLPVRPHAASKQQLPCRKAKETAEASGNSFAVVSHNISCLPLTHSTTKSQLQYWLSMLVQYE